MADTSQNMQLNRAGSDPENIPRERIRNFCIVAHIDHGKSTLADRMIEKTGVLTAREMQDQVLDNIDVERERGITIKSQAVRLIYNARDGQEYMLNLIDTPGHVDFNYEVNRSLAACDGAILVVDATQGIQAQTLANCYLAMEHDLEVFPVINKIDLPSAQPEKVKQEIEDVIGIEAADAPEISAKAGIGIEDVLEAVVAKIPAPSGDPNAPLKSLIFDSLYDSYRGVIVFVRVRDGVLRKGMRVRFMASGAEEEVVEVGYFGPGRFIPCDELSAGMVGYFTASIKNIRDARVGDTVTEAGRECDAPLPGYKKVQPMVFAGLYPQDTSKYPDLKDALEKFQLSDASLSYEPETSLALGFGFRCGFLGLLHMEIIRERLEREFDLDLLATTPNVRYEVEMVTGEVLFISNPVDFPESGSIAEVREPYIAANILVPSEFVGPVMELCNDKRGRFTHMEYLTSERVRLEYDLPLAEIVLDFFDLLKTRSRGYASLDYELKDYEPGDLVRLDIRIAGDVVDALSLIVHEDRAYAIGRGLAERLRKQIPRQMFEVAIQAAVGSRIIARETVAPLRKDVLAKCYGGDISRKRKLLEKQKAGKRRMKMVGTVEIPQEAFLAVLDLGGAKESKK
jgi:GTP-binding protein LepA